MSRRIFRFTACLGLMLLMSNFGWTQSTEVGPLKESLDPLVYQAPAMQRIAEQDKGSIQAIFYDALPFRGKPTRVFAYVGIPESETPLPAMVLVHGGGGTAFHEWVRVWNERGYAAISMSLEGHMPNDQGEGKVRHDASGPERVGRFDDVDLPLEEQWMYRAVSDIMLAHSLLASFSEVDQQRIGVTGISWGGILSSLVSGVDTRFKCAMPVYGCGYLYDSKGFFGALKDSDPETLKKKKYWDPANHFVTGSMPTLWVNGDCDGHFSVDTTSRSFEVTQDHAYMTIHPSMPHGHQPGWDPKRVPEIYAFADQILQGKNPGLGRITRQPSDRCVELEFESQVPIQSATIYYLNEPLTYRQLAGKANHPIPGPWLTFPAVVEQTNSTVHAQLPETCRCYYVNLQDSRGHVVSSVLVELE